MCPGFDSNHSSDDDNSIVELADGTTNGASKPKVKVDSNNRAWVDATSSGIVIIPSASIVHSDDYCTNAGSKPMNVNGSVTPVNFDYSPASGQTRYVDAIGILISDTSSPDFGEFGSLGSALTNGIQLKIRTNGTEYTMANIQDNTDISFHFSGQFDGFTATNLSWLNEVDFYLGFMTFRNALTLKNSTSDYIRFTVRDNLTAIDQLRGFVKAWRVI